MSDSLILVEGSVAQLIPLSTCKPKGVKFPNRPPIGRQHTQFVLAQREVYCKVTLTVKTLNDENNKPLSHQTNRAKKQIA